MTGWVKLPFFSLVNFIKKMSTEIGQDLGIEVPTFVNFDAHANLDDLPKCDLVGIADYAIESDDRLLSIFCSIPVSTFADDDLVRHVGILDEVSKRLYPGHRLPILNVQGVEIFEENWMVVGGSISLEPVTRSNVRAIQSFSLSLGCGLTASSLE